jgi:hypothetical protein
MANIIYTNKAKNIRLRLLKFSLFLIFIFCYQNKNITFIVLYYLHTKIRKQMFFFLVSSYARKEILNEIMAIDAVLFIWALL